MNQSNLAAALSATLAVDAETRRGAEAALADMAKSSAHAAELLRLSASATDPVVAAAAALRLKNAARATRASSSVVVASLPDAAFHPTPLSDEARAHVRDNLLPALAAASAPSVPAALAETLRWLVLLDFPSRWSSLVTQIQTFLSGDAKHVSAALLALHKIGKCYEFRTCDRDRLDPCDSNDAGIAYPREPLDKIAAMMFPELLRLFRRLDNSDFSGARDCQKLIVKLFWCSTQFMLPPCLAEPGALCGWLDAFLMVFQRNVMCSEVTSDEELASLPEFKMKKWIGNVLLRFLKRYGHPKRAPSGEHHTKTIAAIFRDQYAAKATSAMLHVLSWPASGGRLSGRVANIAMDFLQEAVETASLWAVISPHIQLLLSHVVFPYLCFSDEDAELWESDPMEYVRKQTDIGEDFTSPRMAAMNLLSQLSELRPKNTVFPFVTHLVSAVFEPYRQTPPGAPGREGLARQKVGAMQVLNACKVRLRSKPDVANSFLEVLTAHVEPDVRSDFGFLRAMSLKLLGDVASLGWQSFSERLGEVSLRGAVAALEDRELPVQATAGSSLHFLMEEDAAQPLIGPYAPQLLERLLMLLDRMSDGFVSLLPTLDKLMDRYPDQIMPLAVPLMRRLILAFQHSAGEAKNSGDDADDDDDLLFQAAQILQLISSVLTTAGEWSKPSHEERVQMFQILEQELQPVISCMFDEGNHVFAEETLDVLHTLILQAGDLNNKLSPFLMSVVPRLVQSFDSWVGEYVSSDIVGPIEAYVVFGLDHLLAMDGAIPALASIALKLWSEMCDDSEAVDGCKIADVIVLGLSQHTARGSELANRVVSSLMGNAVKKVSTTTGGEGCLRVRLLSTVLLGVYYDGALVVRELGGLPDMVKFLSTVMAEIDTFKRIHDKKAVILGLSALLRLGGDERLNSMCPELVRATLGLQDRVDRQRAGGERKNLQMNQLASWANQNSAVNGGRGTSGFTEGSRAQALAGLQADDNSNSELEDDEDASNLLLDDDSDENEGGDENGGDNVGGSNRELSSLRKLSAATGIPLHELEAMNASGGFSASQGFFEFEDGVDHDDDEGDSPANVLDEIDEIRYFIESVQLASTLPWWSQIGQQERLAIQRLAQRVPLQVQL